MKQWLLGAFVAGIVSGPAQAVTKPTDAVNVIAWVGGPNEEDLVEKKYAKAWKDLSMDAATRQKITSKERELEKTYSASFRIMSLRVDPVYGGGSKIGTVFFVSNYYLVGYDMRTNKYCALSLEGNGGMIVSDGCQY